MRHILGLDNIETANKTIIRIADASIYADFPATCGLLEIQAPGFNIIKQFDVTPNFTLVLNACSLGLQTDDCGDHAADLPDGIWKVKYSVSPNDKVYVEYAWLRTTAFMAKYYDILCNLDMSGCDPSQEVASQLEQLGMIRMYLDSAKAEVEYCHELQKGMDVYKYAKAQLDKLSVACCGATC
jgi:hypothetical protein